MKCYQQKDVSIIKLIEKINRSILRNKNLICKNTKQRNKVNLDYWTKQENVGDALAPVIYDWMLKRRGLTRDSHSSTTSILLTVGSVISINHYDAVIWGSGMHTISSIIKNYNWRKRAKLDIRAVRGPITQQILEFSKYDCTNAALGDPAILMPMIYQNGSQEKKHDVSIVTHWCFDKVDEEITSSGLNVINVNTKDYKYFIDEIVSSRLVISSSLHGIILAESYGVPAIFLNRNNCMKKELMKYYDWYFSTGRYSVKMAMSIEEALRIEPMELPDTSDMCKALINSFPYDLWK